MKKKTLKRFITTAVSMALCASMALEAYASSISDAQSKKQQAESKLDQVQDEIENIQQKQAEIESEIEAVDADLVEVIYNLNITQQDLEETRERLAQAEADLEVARDEEEQQYEAMKTRIAYMYQNSDTGLLETLLSSSSFSDVLNQVTFYSDIYDYDRQALTEFQDIKAEVQELVAEVTEEEENLEEVEKNLEEQQEDLNTLKAEKQAQSDNYETELAKAEELADKYEDTIEEMNNKIEEYEAEAARRAAEEEAARNTASQTTSTGSTSSSSSSKKSTSNKNYSVTDDGAASSTAVAVANYALQFVGNPYVWGGTSLTNGADCSGFTMSVYKHFGVSLPHSSYAQASCGTGVSSPAVGDLICYGGHVAIYIGGGKIVHASSRKTGIKVSSNYRYRTIVAIRRLV